MNSISISIIVPVYNVRNYLRKCLDSVITQSYSNLEIIIIDDGSTDGSSTICDEYLKDKRVKVFHKTNGGLSSARNEGLKHVTGDYISFIDSDDWLKSDYYEVMSIGFEHSPDVISGGYCLEFNGKIMPINNKLQEGLYYGKNITENFVIPLIKSGAHMPVWTNLYKSKLISNLNLSFVSEREVYAEDDLFNTVVYNCTDLIYVVDSNSYIHRVVKGSLSQTYRRGLFNMLSYKRKLKETYFRNSDETDLLYILQTTKPKEVASCLFKESLCSYSEARINIKRICVSSKEVFNLKSKGIGQYRIFFILGKNNQYLLIVVLSKFLKLCEPLYRAIYSKM